MPIRISIARSFALIIALSAGGIAAAQGGTGPDQTTADNAQSAPMIIATKDAPPFAFVGSDGEWTGIAIEAVNAIVADLGRTVEWREDTLDGMLASVAAGDVDAAAAAITITPAREARLDFTFPYYTTGLGIAVDPNAGNGWFRVVRNLFTWQFAVAIATLSAVLLLAGAAVWAFERGHNDEFPKDPARGLGDGFWWAAVTMTTVGYGTRRPGQRAGASSDWCGC